MADQKDRYAVSIADRVARTGRPVFTDFLDPAAAESLKKACKSYGVECDLYGGYDFAERQVGCVYEGALGGALRSEYPITLLRAEYDGRYRELTHPDVLGTLMSLGMDRGATGDISAQKGAVYVFVLNGAAQQVIDGITLIKNVSISFERSDEEFSGEAEAGRFITVTAQSPRLDKVISGAMGISREKARSAVQSGQCRLNYLEATKPDAEIKQGDLISVRGIGRVRIDEFRGNSKKGRAVISCEVFLRK